MLDERLLKGITAQALHDYLRFTLEKPLVCAEDSDEWDLYADAVKYLSRRPNVARLLKSLSKAEMQRLLNKLEDKWDLSLTR